MGLPSIQSVLTRAGLVQPAAFERLRLSWENSGENGRPPEQSLLSRLQEHSGLSEKDFLKRLAEALGWPFLEKIHIPPPDDALAQKERHELMAQLSAKVAFQYQVAPARGPNGEILFAVSDPFHPELFNAVLFEAKKPPRFALTPSDELDKALKAAYGVGAETLEGVAQDEASEGELGEKDIDDSDQEASVIKFVNKVILEAYRSRRPDD